MRNTFNSKEIDCYLCTQPDTTSQRFIFLFFKNVLKGGKSEIKFQITIKSMSKRHIFSSTPILILTVQRTAKHQHRCVWRKKINKYSKRNFLLYF
jgi:hypothetical protein